MFQSDELNNHLRTSHTIKVESLVFAEWNMNDPDNVKRLGNYRYRPSWSGSPYFLLPASYEDIEIGPTYYYTGATDADTVIESGLNEDDQPTLFVSPKEKMKLLFSLEDCIKPFRPRSGINKMLYFGSIGQTPNYNQFIDDPRKEAARRPRYYMASRDDQFKYWTSYRTEYGMPTPMPNMNYPQVIREVPRGYSFYYSTNGLNYIEDAVPFVVYNSSVPTNKIVVKMQTNVGEVDLGPFRYGDTTDVADPLYGDAHKTTPVRWRIEALKGTAWTPLVSFDENSTRSDGTQVIGPDGYVEISYGFSIPEEYLSIFTFAEEIADISLLPTIAPVGYCYLVKQNFDDIGQMYIYTGQNVIPNLDGWETFTPEYNWHLSSEELSKRSNYVTKLANPDYFTTSAGAVYREFEFIDGIRIVVETMNKANCTFDLIEFSPRLVADISGSVANMTITKTMSDLGNSSIPVGGLYASTGSISIFDVDFSFNEMNTFDRQTHSGSIVANYLNNMIKFNMYEGVRDVDGYDYFIPMKTMYSYGFPQSTSPASMLQLELRDMFFFLEASKAPELFLTNVSVSYAVMLLLDSIGFDNYTFRRIADIPEIVIPYFFVEPGQNVAEVLQKLAVASQTAMFFDEYNNFVVMSKEYLLPDSETDRATDRTLYGNVDQQTGDLPSIIAFSTKDKKVYNSGQVNYTTRYLQRSIGSTTAALKIDEYKNYIYKPVILWEVQGNESRQTINELGGQNQGYTLGAIPLNSDLTNSLPYVLNNTLYNNIIDVGENVYWLVNYSGYLYANGEIIKYDAIEYSVAGVSDPVWITSNHQYQDYFSKLKFNGKMYPTGRVRIYTEPEFYKDESSGDIRMKDANPVAKHGRGQFGTDVAFHSAGLITDQFWTNNANVYGCIQEASAYLFNTSEYINYPENLTESTAGKSKTIDSTLITADPLAQTSYRTGVIRNFLTDKYFTESELSYKKTTEPGCVQSSALVVKGPDMPSVLAPQNFVSYIYKNFVDQNGAAIPYKHYGTRMRIVGKIESGTNKTQTPIGAFPLFTGGQTDGTVVAYTAPSATPTSTNNEVIIHGGSGGIGFNVNKDNNTGYFFEIIALTVDNVKAYDNSNNLTIASANIIGSNAGETKPVCVNNEVTVWTKDEITFQVGQKVVIAGLVDQNEPSNTATPLNGEYVITAIHENKKQFKYSINASPALNTTSLTGGVAVADLGGSTNLANVLFYKVVADENGNAVPYRLWSGLSMINIDSGNLYGQGRLMGEENTTVYDLAAEYQNIGSFRRFYLYINNKQVAVVDDESPLEERNNLALFVRGSSKCMFENVYALMDNYSQNTKFSVLNGISKVFGDEDIDANDAFRKYAVSGLVQKTYLSGISAMEDPRYKIYFEEFGTILREAAYFNIKYDRAYPALYAKLQKTTNNLRGYTTSGFYAWSYGADFLIFNCTDFAINLDDTSGNFLRILGAAFTQSTTYTLTVDDLYKKRSNLIDTALGKNPTLYDPLKVNQEYNIIKNSRNKYGTNEITLESPYIQETDVAENIFSWIINKVSRPRRMIGMTVFGTSNMQLGDIVKIKYLSNEGVDVIADPDTRFTIYQIEYNKSVDEITTTMFLAEV